VRVPFCCINSWLISYRHRYCTYLYYYNHHHFRLAGIRDLIIDESLRHEFHGSCVDPMRIGEASHAEANDALDAVVKAKLDNYQHDYNERNFCESVLVLVVRVYGGLPGSLRRRSSPVAAGLLPELFSRIDSSCLNLTVLINYVLRRTPWESPPQTSASRPLSEIRRVCTFLLCARRCLA